MEYISLRCLQIGSKQPLLDLLLDLSRGGELDSLARFSTGDASEGLQDVL